MDAMKIMTEGMVKADQPKFNIGDTVRVSVRIKEGERERIQAFEGTVIAKRHGGVAETFNALEGEFYEIAPRIGNIIASHIEDSV